MATLSPNYPYQPRTSTDTERHLLADSVAPSETSSILTRNDADEGERTPRAHSPAPTARRDTIAAPSTTPQPYRGFPSEAHYLAALNEWADKKKFIYYDTSLIGFYGQKTMGDYANQPGANLGEMGLRKKWRARKERKAEKKAVAAGERRNTVA